MRRFPESRGANQNKTLIFRKVHRRALPHRLQPVGQLPGGLQEEAVQVRYSGHHHLHHHQHPKVPGIVRGDLLQGLGRRNQHHQDHRRLARGNGAVRRVGGGGNFSRTFYIIETPPKKRTIYKHI